MSIWDFLLSSSSIVFTAIITYIPLRYDMHHKTTHRVFLIFAVLAVASGVGATYNLWRSSVKAETDKTNQQSEFSRQLSDLKKSNSRELIDTRRYIVDSMTSIYNKEGERQKEQLDSSEKRHNIQLDSLEASKQRKLNSFDKNRLVRLINDALKSNNLSINTPINVSAPLGDNEARIYAREIVEFLKFKRFNVIAISNSATHDIISEYIENTNQFRVLYNERDGYISIGVGVLGNRP